METQDRRIISPKWSPCVYPGTQRFSKAYEQWSLTLHEAPKLSPKNQSGQCLEKARSPRSSRSKWSTAGRNHVCHYLYGFTKTNRQINITDATENTPRAQLLFVLASSAMPRMEVTQQKAWRCHLAHDPLNSSWLSRATPQFQRGTHGSKTSPGTYPVPPTRQPCLMASLD